MGVESLIPFGLNAESGQLEDVGSVKRGNACGCICPSCKTPLVARQGGLKEWHFAHRSQKVHNKTRNECEYSFAVSVRLMIRQLSNDGLKFRAPRYESSLHAYSERSCESKDFWYLVTDESLLILNDVQVGVHFSGVTVDVLGHVKGIPFVVFVTYKERNLPLELKSPLNSKCGVIELNVDAVPRLFKQEAKGQYKEILRRYIEDETDGKTWAYHPREQKLSEAALEKRDFWLLQQATEVKIQSTKRRCFQSPVEPNATGSSSESDMSVKHIIKEYTCKLCKSTWTGESMICKNCDTHLYTTEKK